MEPVKTPSARQRKAAATRRRMLVAAYECFGEHGFRATTMDAIAAAAGVAVQTLYFTFHTKDELLQQVMDWMVLGDDGIPPPRQDWFVAAIAEPDARRSMGVIVGGLAAISARVAPMLPVFHAVSADPAGAVYRRSEELRRAGMEQLVDVLVTKERLRAGMTKRRAVDLLVVLGGPESYRSFVVDAGWSARQWTTWVTATLNRDLFGEASAATRAPGRPPK